MALGASRILGIAVEDRCLLVAELAVGGRRRTLRRAAEFPFPEGLSLEDPVALGKALRTFLRRERFSAGRAVFGVPGSWLVVREKTFPPAADAAFAGMVRLEAEQAFAGGPEDLAVDYAEDAAASDGAGRTVVLVAMSRARLEQVSALARAAGLTARAVVPTVMALGAAAPSSSSSEITVYLGQRHAEVALRVGRRFPVVRHVAGAAPAGPGVDPQGMEQWAAGIAGQVRQLVSLLPADGASPAPEQVVIWDGAAPQPGELVGLCDRLPLPTIVRAGLSALDVEAGSAVADGEGPRFAAPVAVALAAERAEDLRLDLLHSRLALPRRHGLARRLAWAIVVAAALAACGVVLVGQWREEQRGVAALRAQVAELKPDLDVARSVVGKVVFARGWYDQRAPFLDCLRELTLAFPEKGTIWATSIGVREDLRTVVSGKATDEKAVLEVLDRLKQSKALVDVKLLHLREAGGSGREVSFAIRFTFSGAE